MTAAVFIQPLGYDRACRLLTIGTSRHITACLASIPADEPVLVTAAQPEQLCSACREDMRVRVGRREDLTPWSGEIGTRAEVAVARTTTPDLRGPRTVEWDEIGGFGEADEPQAPTVTNNRSQT